MGQPREPLEKETATHSSVLTQKIPQTEETGGLYRPEGRKESDTTERLSTIKGARSGALPTSPSWGRYREMGVQCSARLESSGIGHGCRALAARESPGP